MKNVIRVIMLCSIFFSTIATAGFEWRGPYTIKESYAWYEQGHALTSITINELDGLNTGCVKTDSVGIISYWVKGSFNVLNTTWVSMSLTAQAQNKKVMLYVDANNCSTWAGARLNGIKVLSD